MFEIDPENCSLLLKKVSIEFLRVEEEGNAKKAFKILSGSPFIKKNPCIKRYGPAIASCSIKGNPKLLKNAILNRESITTKKFRKAKLLNFEMVYFSPFSFQIENCCLFSLLGLFSPVNLYPNNGSKTKGAIKYIYITAIYAPATDLLIIKLTTGIEADNAVIFLFLLQNFLNLFIIISTSIYTLTFYQNLCALARRKQINQTKQRGYNYAYKYH